MNQIECYKCPVCGWEPPETAAGGSWDHCPNCLSGTHGPCGGILEPIGVWVRKNGEWAILHRCTVCGKISSNRIAADDNPMRLMALAMRPFGSAAISQNHIRQMIRTMED